jgi:uncharacterized membrane protein
MTEPGPASPARAARLPAVILALVGLALSLVLEFIHYRAYTAPSAHSFCTVGAALDCTSVALSRWSLVLGVPMPLWGAAGFLALLVAAWQRSRWLLPLSALAALASVALLVIELVAIGAVCLLCEGIHVVSLLLLAVAWRGRGSLHKPLRDRDDLLFIFAPAAGILIALALFLPRYWGAFNWRGDIPFAQGKTEDGFPWIGAREPKLVVQEFTDYSCPHCKVVSNRTLRLLAEHPNELRLVRRQYPRMSCPQGSSAHCQLARIAYCADEQGKFWQADRWLFEHATGRHEVQLEDAAGGIGLDQASLKACIERPDIYTKADEASRFARKKRITGTPYYIVGDKPLPPDRAYEAMKEL